MITDINQARGDFICIFCGSFSRKRHIAKVVNEFISNTSYISQIPEKSKIKIYNVDIDDAFYKTLYGYEYYFCSDLCPDKELGREIKSRVFCQDIEKLTFQNESFDLVITEDVFEHVRNYENGFKEILRVLKQGGYHIFTIPFNFDRSTIKRVDTSNNKDIYILEPEYHESKTGKVLTYRTFGIDLFDFLDSIGYETSLDFSGYFTRKFKIYDSFVFISKKL
jgi:SAM-dependent methyltransferase